MQIIFLLSEQLLTSGNSLKACVISTIYEEMTKFKEPEVQGLETIDWLEFKQFDLHLDMGKNKSIL